MRKTLFEVGAATAAGSITYIVSASIGTLNSAIRWGSVVAIAVVAFTVAWLVVRRSSSRHANGDTSPNGIRIGTRVSAKEDVQIGQIEVAPGSDNVTVGEDVKTKGKASISHIFVGRARRKN